MNTLTKLKRSTKPYLCKGETVYVWMDMGRGEVWVDRSTDYNNIFLVSSSDLQEVKKSVKPVPKESKKRAVENREYLTLKKVYLENHLVCEANIAGCTRKATEVHHAAGRIGKRLVDVSTFVPLCGNCHRWVENNAVQAKEMGLSVNRL